MTDVIVTGASGFIGRALVRRLERDGLDVLALRRDAGDIADAATWRDLPKTKTVMHLAGRSYVPDSWKEPYDFLRANVIGTGQALSYCQRHGAKLILASAYVYGVPERLPLSENHPMHPNNPYALSKRMAEELCEFACRFQGVAAAVLRLFNVYGPGQRPEFLIPTILSQLCTGRDIRVMDLTPRRDYVYVEDVADAFVQAAKLPPGCHVFNIGSGRSHSVQEIIDTLQRVAGTALPVVSENAVRPQEIPDVVADISRAKEILGWSPRRSLEQGLKELLAR
ncbi:MAG: NAD-dependent epimerase/dehydratase family protein [Pseudomonadota bacterium]|nr:NAD-dependent epimerase/dehydratase family protein [Pseudomonadota bacterium]